MASGVDLEALRTAYLGELGRAVGTARDVALVDFPAHTNVGDAAIWLGELKAMARLRLRVRYTCHFESYRPDRLRRVLGPDGVILLHGGGNFGDLWPPHHALRERVLSDFPDRPVVQLPQTMCFRSEETLERARRVLDAHPRLTLLLRDERSLAAARDTFASPSRLCPDAAFLLEPAHLAPPPEAGMLWLLRLDHESNLDEETRTMAESVNWLAERRGRLHSLARRLDAVALGDGATARMAGAAAAHVHLRLARRRLRRGYGLVTSAKVVISDRLHVHVLCLLSGVPHVILEDRYGKVRSFIETWTAPSPLVRFAADPEEARAVAGRWLAKKLS